MKAPVFLSAMLGMVALCCSCKHTTTHATSEWLYLGIPADEEYPDTRFHLDSQVPEDKYWRVSRVRHLTKDEYQRDVAAGHMLFREHHSGTQFYATELRGDFIQRGDSRYWVTILERKAFP